MTRIAEGYTEKSAGVMAGLLEIAGSIQKVIGESTLEY